MICWDQCFPDAARILRLHGAEMIVISTIGDAQGGICLAEVDLDESCYVHWLSVGDANGQPRSLYLKERRTDLYRKYRM